MRDRIGIFTDDVADQHHLRQSMPTCLGCVADGLHITMIEMLETGEDGAARTGVEIVLDLDDRRHRIADLPEELEADGACVRRHLVQDEARRRDDSVAAFLLHAGQAGEKFVGDVLAESDGAELLSGNRQYFATDQVAQSAFRAEVRIPRALERRDFRIVNLAAIVVGANHFEPFAIRGHHPPRIEIVDRGAPQHGLLAAGIHRDVAADARRIGRCRIDGEHEALVVGRVHHAPGDDAGAAVDRRDVFALRRVDLDVRHPLQLLGIDHRGHGRQRHRAACVTGAAATRNDGEAELDAAFDQTLDFLLVVRVQNDERILDAPVGGIGDMRDAREAIEGDVVAARVAR